MGGPGVRDTVRPVLPAGVSANPYDDVVYTLQHTPHHYCRGIAEEHRCYIRWDVCGRRLHLQRRELLRNKHEVRVG